MRYKTVIGLNENVVGVLTYIGFWITGILFMLIERNNLFVRFHALQSFLLFLPLSLLIFVLGWIPVAGWLIAEIMGFASMLLLLVLAFKAYRGDKFKIPVIGNIAYRNTYGVQK
ncbi:protein of unknown function UPF0132 [Methanosalsum zhilinae DSM 4017]|uniref:DUF4870 domain-containing protein n=1 Tax=Methanosalsum zhilinae (strain DSM 4017 / NBRC 107636 / OCM 62 / WeN5) TaxID=679901 RepID=F7XPN6_METZD|nr:membrane protein [Methanosalsum zhilinae]AEH60306.1 protein of unknown function UPF0132 [Methanosalsum zhilinae DSM 4017]